MKDNRKKAALIIKVNKNAITFIDIEVITNTGRIEADSFVSRNNYKTNSIINEMMAEYNIIEFKHEVLFKEED